MCGDWGMCKSNYLLTAVAEREGWEWHRGSSRRWALSICHSAPLHNPLPTPCLYFVSLFVPRALILFVPLSLSFCVSWSVLMHNVFSPPSFIWLLYVLFLFMINSIADNHLNVSVPQMSPTGSAKIIILVSSIGWTNRLQIYTICSVSVDVSEQKHHGINNFSNWIYQWLTYSCLHILRWD